MYFLDKIKELTNNEKMIMFVDMDGVIADYDMYRPYDFSNKRPLTSNIKVLTEISKLDNIELHILSVCKQDFQIKEKNDWLDIYAPCFKKENRTVISKETIPNVESKNLKCNFLKEFINNTDAKVILIDDDNAILKTVRKEIENITLFQDSSLID